MPKRSTLNELIESAVQLQRNAGHLPRPEETARYLGGVLTRMDQKPATGPVTKPERPPETVINRAEGVEVYRRELTDDELNEKPAPVAPIVRLLLARVHLLKSYPDWHERLKQVNPLCLAGVFGVSKQADSIRAVIRICNASERLFGDWRKPQH